MSDVPHRLARGRPVCLPPRLTTMSSVPFRVTFALLACAFAAALAACVEPKSPMAWARVASSRPSDARPYRWPSRSTRPLRIYVQPASLRTGWSDSHVMLAQRALDAWAESGAIELRRASRSRGADIRLFWTDGLPTAHPGVTVLTPNVRGELHHADIWVNVRIAPRKTASSEEVLYAIIAHEIGHALGLPHVQDRETIMHPVLHTLTVTPADLDALRELRARGSTRTARR